MNIPASTPLAFIGFVCLGGGAFMVLAGLGIVNVERVSVTQGTRTWVIGAVLAILGIALLSPEILPYKVAKQEAADSVVATEASDSADSPDSGADEATQEESTGSTELGPEWTRLDFDIPSPKYWEKTADGSYTALGDVDTFAWSDENIEGDFELAMDVQSDGWEDSAVVVVYGNGSGFSKGDLIVVLENPSQRIQSYTVYEGGEVLDLLASEVDIQGGAHAAAIEVKDRIVTVTLDGNVILSSPLGDDINRAGRFALYKWGGSTGATMSNIRIRVPAGSD